jgi:predicted transcriptional regulator
MKVKALKKCLLLAIVALMAINICSVQAENVRAENLTSLSVVEIFILAFCFLFAVGLVIVWQFCFRKNR